MNSGQSEIIVVDNDVEEISCDGGGFSGHPRVWYSFDSGVNEVRCGYCDRVFSRLNHTENIINEL